MNTEAATTDITGLINAGRHEPVVNPANDLEWSGTLARASSHRALFSLYLAMHCQPGSKPLTIDDAFQDKAADDVGFPDRINHYPRAALSPTQQDFAALNVSSALANKGEIVSLSLWQMMHPDPLSAHNDTTLLPDDVKANCSYATQQRLKQAIASTIDTDPTTLDDVITGSQQLLTA